MPLKIKTFKIVISAVTALLFMIFYLGLWYKFIASIADKSLFIHFFKGDFMFSSFFWIFWTIGIMIFSLIGFKLIQNFTKPLSLKHYFADFATLVASILIFDIMTGYLISESMLTYNYIRTQVLTTISQDNFHENDI